MLEASEAAPEIKQMLSAEMRMACKRKLMRKPKTVAEYRVTRSGACWRLRVVEVAEDRDQGAAMMLGRVVVEGQGRDRRVEGER